MGLIRKIINLKNRIFNKYVFKINKVDIPENYYANGIIYISNSGTMKIGDKFRFNSGKHYNPIGGDINLRLIVKKEGKLILGENCQLSNSTIYCTSSIFIGSNVYIGGGCKIYDTDFHAVDLCNRINAVKEHKLEFIKTKPVIIEDGVWIGGHCIVLKGVTIGQEAIVGAGSVVTKNIPAKEIWAGNPIRKIRKID